MTDLTKRIEDLSVADLKAFPVWQCKVRLANGTEVGLAVP